MSLLAVASPPRVRLAPRAAANDAEDAAFLASSYGLTPDPWQADVLEDWLGRRKDGRWSAATCGLAVPRQNGKNGAIEVRELFGMVVLGEKFLHTAHEVKTARKAFLRIASFFENPREYPELAALAKEIRKTNGQEAVVLTNGASVEFIARSRGSGRGFTVDVLVCDEAQDLTDEELAALLPTISAAPTGNPQVILTGTPPDPEKDTQGEVFRRVRADGEARRDKRLAWTDFGVQDGPMPDADDRDLWVQVNPALGIRLNLFEVERERALMSPETFARERLGWWGDPSADASPLPLEAWEACRDTASTFSTSGTVLGLHVTPDQRIAYLAGAGRSPKGLAHVEVLAEVSTSRVVAEAARLSKARGGVSVWLDPGSHAGALIPDLEAEGLKVEPVTLQKLAQGCGMVINDVTTGALAHRGQDVLDTAVRNAGVRVTSRDSWTWAGPNVTPLSAVTLARYGLAAGPTPYNLAESVW